jgi:hypothetical protein
MVHWDSLRDWGNNMGCVHSIVDWRGDGDVLLIVHIGGGGVCGMSSGGCGKLPKQLPFPPFYIHILAVFPCKAGRAMLSVSQPSFVIGSGKHLAWMTAVCCHPYKPLSISHLCERWVVHVMASI